MAIWGNIFAPSVIAAQSRKARSKARKLAKARGLVAKSDPDMQGEIQRQAKAMAYRLAGQAKPKLATPAPTYRRGMGKDFYWTWEWRRVRYGVLQRLGAKCQCCGATDKIHVDHIKPRSKYPDLELVPANLQILCEACNMGKSNLDETDWRKNPGVALAPSRA